MPFAIDDLRSAYQAYQNFLANNPLPFHARYIFPFFAGSYFTYRKIDVIYVATIAKSIANDPSYLDVGCGYGDFLKRIREFLPEAKGIEKDAGIFYSLAIPKPDFIEISDARWINKKYDMIFVGWMEPGQDFREYVARYANCIVTTFDSGGQCGTNGGCEYDEFGFERLAWWRTPSWIDVNTELMNHYYTPSLDDEKKGQLARLRTAHNFWYIYTKPQITDRVRSILQSYVHKEQQRQERDLIKQRYDFETILDECGFRYGEELSALISGSSTNQRLWTIRFD
jgi:hypothetical protein